MNQEFLVDIQTESWNNWSIILLNGKFVVRHLTQIRKLLENLESENVSNIAIDLSGTTHLDSSAITLMLNFQKRMTARNGKLAVMGPNEDILGIFTIVGLDIAIPVYPNRSAFEKAFSH